MASKIHVPSNIFDVDWLFEWNPQIARLSSDPIGQWILPLKKDEVDKRWLQFVGKYRNGALKGIHSMKVSTWRHAKNKENVIVFYSESANNQDFTSNVLNGEPESKATYVSGGTYLN